MIRLLATLQSMGLEPERAGCLSLPRWIELVRQVVLYRLDELWTEHLAETAELRESIHLRALANATPLVEFTVEARRVFAGFENRVVQAVLSTLRELDLEQPPSSLAELGLRRPSSTWTYMVEDNPFGTTADRVIRSLAKLVGRP